MYCALIAALTAINLQSYFIYHKHV